MDSEDMTRALIAMGASGAENRHKKYRMSKKICFCTLNNFSITILLSLAVNWCRLNAVSAGCESQNLHAIVCVFLKAVQNSLAGRRNLGVLRILVVPRVGRSVDDLKQIFKDATAKGFMRPSRVVFLLTL